MHAGRNVAWTLWEWMASNGRGRCNYGLSVLFMVTQLDFEV